MEIILNHTKSWDTRKVLRLYRGKNFKKHFIDAMCSDDDVQRFIYANAFYERVRFDGKVICDKISDDEIKELIGQQYNDFISIAEYTSQNSKNIDDIFQFIECDGIYDEMDAVMTLRDELIFTFNGISSVYFHDGRLDSISDQMRYFFTYNSKKHSGKKFNSYLSWIMQHKDALGFLGGSMYLQEIIDPDDELNFDIFYELIQSFLLNFMNNCDIDKDSRVIKTTFSRDLKKIFKNVYKINKKLAI